MACVFVCFAAILAGLELSRLFLGRYGGGFMAQRKTRINSMYFEEWAVVLGFKLNDIFCSHGETIWLMILLCTASAESQALKAVAVASSFHSQEQSNL